MRAKAIVYSGIICVRHIIQKRLSQCLEQGSISFFSSKISSKGCATEQSKIPNAKMKDKENETLRVIAVGSETLPQH